MMDNITPHGRWPRLALAVVVWAAALLVVAEAHAARRFGLEQRAMQACMSAFIERIVPDAPDRAKYVMPAESSVFSGSRTYDRAKMTLSARDATSGGELASGICTVGRDTLVKQLSIRISDAARLATLRPADLKLSVSAR